MHESWSEQQAILKQIERLTREKKELKSTTTSPPRSPSPLKTTGKPSIARTEANQPEFNLPTNVAKKRALQQLSLSTIKTSDYSDFNSGPLRPGFDFFPWLARGPSLEMQIPAMIYMKGLKVSMHLQT